MIALAPAAARRRVAIAPNLGCHCAHSCPTAASRRVKCGCLWRLAHVALPRRLYIEQPAGAAVFITGSFSAHDMRTHGPPFLIAISLSFDAIAISFTYTRPFPRTFASCRGGATRRARSSRSSSRPPASGCSPRPSTRRSLWFRPQPFCKSGSVRRLFPDFACLSIS